MNGHGLRIDSSDVTASATRSYIDLYGENDAPSGVAIISTATGGTVWIKTTGTGATEIGNETTNQDTTLQVAGNGTGKPIINLKNDTMAASLEVTTDEELSIKGGTDLFKFDVSSATGGITWPDGTSQISAASGGGTTFVSPTTANASYDRINIAAAPFYGGNGFIGQFSHTTSTTLDNPTFWQYLAPFTANISSIKLYVSSGGATNVVLGIYADAGGYPGALIGKATFDVTSTGYKDLTSFLDSGGSATTIPQTEGTTYWVGYVRETTAVAWSVYGVTANVGSTIMIQEPDDSNYRLYNLSSSSLALPATVTATDLVPKNNLPGGRVALAIK